MKQVLKFTDTPIIDSNVSKARVQLIVPKIYLQELEHFTKLKTDTYYTVEVKKAEEKKTDQQRAYCWELITLLAYGMKPIMKPNDVYRQLVLDFNAHFPNTVPSEIKDVFKSSWEEKGIGWFAEEISDNGIDTMFICYYGMSKWSKEQTSDFIELIKMELQEQGIPYEREV